MQGKELQHRLLTQHNLRVEPQMLAYLLNRFEKSGEAIPVIGGDARTGAPMRLLVDPATLMSDAAASQGNVAP